MAARTRHDRSASRASSCGGSIASAATPLIMERTRMGPTRASPTSPSASARRSSGTSSDTCHSMAAACMIRSGEGKKEAGPEEPEITVTQRCEHTIAIIAGIARIARIAKMSLPESYAVAKSATAACKIKQEKGRNGETRSENCRRRRTRQRRPAAGVTSDRRDRKHKRLLTRVPLVFSISRVALPRAARLASPHHFPILPFSRPPVWSCDSEGSVTATNVDIDDTVRDSFTGRAGKAWTEAMRRMKEPA